MKYSCLICTCSGSLVNACTDLQLTILFLYSQRLFNLFSKYNWDIFQSLMNLASTEDASIKRVVGEYYPPNFEILMVWNPISIVQRGQFLSKTSLKLIICQFFWISVSVNNIYYTLLGVLVSSIVRIHLKNVKIRIFLSQ